MKGHLAAQYVIEAAVSVGRSKQDQYDYWFPNTTRVPTRSRSFTLLSTQLDYFLASVSRPDNLRPAAAAAAAGHSHPADGKSGHAGVFTHIKLDPFSFSWCSFSR